MLLQNLLVSMQIRRTKTWINIRSEKLVACDSHWYLLWNNILQARNKNVKAKQRVTRDVFPVSPALQNLLCAIILAKTRMETLKLGLFTSTHLPAFLSCWCVILFLIILHKVLSCQTRHRDTFIIMNIIIIIMQKSFCSWGRSFFAFII